MNMPSKIQYCQYIYIMKNLLKMMLLAAAALLLLAGCQKEELTPPNIVILFVDDLGFSDPGCYGGEIQTPNLDQLAGTGLRYTQFRNTARCWPSRAALLTGYYPQQVGRDRAPGIKGGAQGIRPEWARLLPEYLVGADYRSYHSGKWHVDGMPVENGFDKSYFLNDQNRLFSPTIHYVDDIKLAPVERGSGYYATTEIADRAIDQLKVHSSGYSDQPFFAFVAFTAPHFPLHALPEDIKRIGDRYTPGWDKLRAERWDRIQNMGIITGQLSDIEPQVGPPYNFPEAFEILGEAEVNRPVPWNTLTPAQKKFQQEKMAIHAAMIERVDLEIGRILEQLREMNAFQNTLILFLSDNGASAEIMVRGDGHDTEADPGSADTYLCLGPGWSTMCNTPFRRHKTWVHEGGACTPFIVHWPRGIEARGELRDDPGHVIDLVPTILDLAGVDISDILKVPMPGRSLVPTFVKDTDWQRSLWWYHEGNRALQSGDWKIVSARDEPWELYDLAGDRTESHNLALDHPEQVEEMGKEWEKILAGIREVAPERSEGPHKTVVTDH
jgi:arylsulfatase A-like enzyme